MAILFSSLNACIGRSNLPPTTTVTVVALPQQSQPASLIGISTAKPTIAPSDSPTPMVKTPTITSRSVTPTLTLTPTFNSSKTPTLKTSDLLYIQQENLMRWDPVTNFTGMLAQDVVDYSLNETGNIIVLLRTTRITANGVEQFTLDYLDMSTKQIQTLISGLPRLAHFSVSPDGNRIAYIGQENGGMIYLVNREGNGEPILLASCNYSTPGHCGQFAWSPDSQTLLWSDAQGLWKTTVNHVSPVLVHSEYLSVTDPEGQESEIQVVFIEARWSPNGRYVLTKIAPQNSQVRWSAIVDTVQGRIIEIPTSYENTHPSSDLIWLRDGELVSVHIEKSAQLRLPVITLWNVVPTHNNLLVPEKVFPLKSEHFPIIPDPTQSEYTYCLRWLSQIHTDLLALGVTIPGTNVAPVLFHFDLNRGWLIKAHELPYSSQHVLWSPDGNGVLVIGNSGQHYYAPTGGEVLIDLNPILGADAHTFHWLPPASRY